MVKVGNLIVKEKGKKIAKKIFIFENPSNLRKILSPLSIKIIKILKSNPSYAIEIAEKLGEHEQKIYYHLRKLENLGVIREREVIKIRGGNAKIYELDWDGFGYTLEGGIPLKEEFDSNLISFFKEFIEEGRIVVGSPDPHGKYNQRARDNFLLFYLGKTLSKFITKPVNIYFDVDIKRENRWSENLILLGGPRANLITEEINQYLKYKLNDYEILGEKKYTESNIGIIEKIRNPFDKNKWIIVFAGIKREGTESAIKGICYFSKEILKDYEGGEFHRVVEGLDLNGDGIIDYVRVLE